MKKYQNCVAVMLVKNGKACLSKRLKVTTYTGKYQFPGGQVEPGEDILLAAQRELREETGLDISLDRFIEGGEDADEFTEKLIYYIVKLEDNEEPRQTEPDKSGPWQWYTPEEALKLPLVPSRENFLSNFFYPK
jgi:8-oxo-dGTP pyrophosphatase MutT (NUDIX family)